MNTTTEASATMEVGKRLADLCRHGKHMEAIEALYSPDIVSIEAQGTCGQVTARNADSSWVYFNTTNQKGWAYVKYLAGEGDLSTLPVLAGLTPTP